MIKLYYFQRGFSLVSAIFLLVVLALLGTMMTTFFGSQQQTLGMDVQGSRAYQAARAGIEWGAYNVSVAAPGAVCGNLAAPIAAGTLQGGLAQFTVNLQCVPAVANEGGVTINIYTLTATANNGAPVGSPDRVERSITALIRK